MRFQVIACEIMFRELCRASAEAEAVLDLVFLRKGLHDNPDVLRETVQAHIDAVDPARCEAVVLGYGLCCNGVVGLQARDVPLVIPRGHDCITFFLGSRERYARVFAERPGTYYYTSGWLERGGDQTAQPLHQGGGLMDQAFADLVAKYGEDNARYLLEFTDQWRENYTTVCYIRLPLYDRGNHMEEARRIAAENGWEYIEVEGDDCLFRAMVGGQWSEEDFLIVPPGCTIQPSYDDLVLRCGASPEGCPCASLPAQSQ
jgi:hypothetical protein